MIIEFGHFSFKNPMITYKFILYHKLLIGIFIFYLNYFSLENTINQRDTI
jgi:hypothetical protein